MGDSNAGACLGQGAGRDPEADRWAKVADDDPACARWLGNVRTAHTRNHYRTSMRTFCGYARMSPTDLIKEADADRGRSPLERTDMARHRVIKFYGWLLKDAPRRDPCRRIIGKGMTEGTASTFISGLQSFYAYFGLPLRLKGAQAIPRGRVVNKRMRLTPEQVKLLADNVRTPRDRAIVWMAFQSGADADTLCGLKWRDVRHALDPAAKPPVRLSLYRAKEDIEYITFMGTSALEALRAYANDLKSRGFALADAEPVFIRGKRVPGSKARLEALEPDNIWLVMKGSALKTGLLKKSGYNTVGLHALRESFSSILLNAGLQRDWIDELLGHATGSKVLSRAYFDVFERTAGKAYAKAMHLLEPGGAVPEEELQARIQEEVDRQGRELREIIVRSMARIQALEAKGAEVEELKVQVEELRKQGAEIAKRVQI